MKMMKLATLRPFLIPFIILVFSGITLGIVFSKTVKENLTIISPPSISQGYADCISKGYTKSFCLQTSTSAIGPAGCTCPNGNIGTIKPGFRGGCICKDS